MGRPAPRSPPAMMISNAVIDAPFAVAAIPYPVARQARVTIIAVPIAISIAPPSACSRIVRANDVESLDYPGACARAIKSERPGDPFVGARAKRISAQNANFTLARWHECVKWSIDSTLRSTPAQKPIAAIVSHIHYSLFAKRVPDSGSTAIDHESSVLSPLKGKVHDPGVSSHSNALNGGQQRGHPSRIVFEESAFADKNAQADPTGRNIPFHLDVLCNCVTVQLRTSEDFPRGTLITRRERRKKIMPISLLF